MTCLNGFPKNRRSASRCRRAARARGLTDDTTLLRVSRLDQVANNNQSGRNADTGLQRHAGLEPGHCTDQFHAALTGLNPGFTFGPCNFEWGAVLSPSGLRLFYRDLQQTIGERGPQWEFMYGGETKKIYGGKLLENIVQALARIITMDAALRIQKRLGLGMQVHDELVYGVPTEAVEDFKAIALQEMRRRPAWAPELPLEAEPGVGSSYGEAK